MTTAAKTLPRSFFIIFLLDEGRGSKLRKIKSGKTTRKGNLRRERDDFCNGSVGFEIFVRV